MLVVFAHAREVSDPVTGVLRQVLPGSFGYAGVMGVDVFFVLSGFIMYYIHHGDVGQPGRAAEFGWRRFSRIYPFYWVICAVDLLTRISPWRADGVPGIKVMFLSVTLLPDSIPPFVRTAWTLRHEVRFYALFGLLLLLPARVALAVTLAIATVAAGFLGGDILNVLPTESKSALYLAVLYLFHPCTLEFAAGVLCAHLHLTGKFNRWTAGAALLLGFAGAFAGTLLYPFAVGETHIRYGALITFGPVAVMLIHGVTSAESLWNLAVPAWLVRLGDASYSIYLVHLPIFAVAEPFLYKVPLPDLVRAGLLIGISIAIGLLAHLHIERPLMDFCRRLRKSWGPAPVAA